MTLTEEQREAIRVISKLPMAIGCQLCHPYIMENYGSHFIVLRAMIDSSEHVTDHTKMIGFDLEKNPECSAWDLDEQSIEDQRRLRRNIIDWQAEEIKRLKDELENYGDHYACLLISKDAQIKDLEGMLSIRTEELDIAHSVARSEKEMHEKELAAFARRIKELEDALVEERARVITSHPLTHVIDEDRTEASMQLQAEGKIGPDARPKCDHAWQAAIEERGYQTCLKCGECRNIEDIPRTAPAWQITEERKKTLIDSIELIELNTYYNDHTMFDLCNMLRAMLTEAGQE